MPQSNKPIPTSCPHCGGMMPSRHKAVRKGCPHCGKRVYYHQIYRSQGMCGSCGEVKTGDKFRCDGCQEYRAQMLEQHLTKPGMRDEYRAKWRRHAATRARKRKQQTQ